MPVFHSYLDTFGLNVVRIADPFEPGDLVQLARRDLDSGVDPDRVAGPLLLDFRAAVLTRHKAGEFGRIARQRAAMTLPVLSAPCAYLAGDIGSFGMLRMMASYAEIANLRSGADTLITMDVNEAADWLSLRLGQTGEDAGTLRRALADGVDPQL